MLAISGKRPSTLPLRDMVRETIKKYNFAGQTFKTRPLAGCSSEGCELIRLPVLLLFNVEHPSTTSIDLSYRDSPLMWRVGSDTAATSAHPFLQPVMRPVLLQNPMQDVRHVLVKSLVNTDAPEMLLKCWVLFDTFPHTSSGLNRLGVKLFRRYTFRRDFSSVFSSEFSR